MNPCMQYLIFLNVDNMKIPKISEQITSMKAICYEYWNRHGWSADEYTRL